MFLKELLELIMILKKMLWFKKELRILKLKNDKKKIKIFI